jgi:hypothetical protein
VSSCVRLMVLRPNKSIKISLINCFYMSVAINIYPETMKASGSNKPRLVLPGSLLLPVEAS